MSKIGETPVHIKQGVNVTITDSAVTVKGQEGEVSVPLPKRISVKEENGYLKVERKSDESKVKAMHGLVRALLNNAVIGVVRPWTKTLKIVGTGYRVKDAGESLIFEVGYSHSVEFKKPKGASVVVKGSNVVTVSGVDRQEVGEVAYKIRSIKRPDAYKGKGIQYEGEILRLKPGKKAATASE